MKLVILHTLLASIYVLVTCENLTLYKFSDAEVETYGARCIDGTPGGYFSYFNNGKGQNKLAIYLQGGGWCFIDSPNKKYYQDCTARLNTPMGSSSKFSAQVSAPVYLLSNSPQVNPDFYDWNFVYIPYCSGDLYSGTNMEPYNNTGLYNSGHNIIVATIAHLKSIGQWDIMTEIIVTGGSAGAFGSHINIDYIQSQHTSANITVYPNAGWFIPFYTYVNTGVSPTELMALFAQRNKPYQNQKCHEVYSKLTDLPVCIWANYSYPYWNARSFIVQNLYDSNQLFAQNFVPLQNGAIPASACGYVEEFGATMMKDLAPVINGNSYETGIFMPSCFVHVVAPSEEINGENFEELFGDWYFQRPSREFPNYKALDNCVGNALTCNPTCNVSGQQVINTSQCQK